MSNVEVYRTLVLSTSHLPESLADDMQYGVEKPFAYESGTYGYRVYLGGEDLSGFSASMTPIVKRARELRCRWVEFDEDGNEHPDFETYDW